MAFYVNEDKPDNLATVHRTKAPAAPPSLSRRRMADGTVLLTPKMSRCASPTKLTVQSRNADGVSPDRPELPEGA